MRFCAKHVTRFENRIQIITPERLKNFKYIYIYICTPFHLLEPNICKIVVFLESIIIILFLYFKKPTRACRLSRDISMMFSCARRVKYQRLEFNFVSHTVVSKTFQCPLPSREKKYFIKKNTHARARRQTDRFFCLVRR